MTNPMARQLLPLLTGLRAWEPTIRKSTYSNLVEIELVPEGIKVIVKWQWKETSGEWSRLFTNAELLGSTSAGSSIRAANRRFPACTYARQVISGVLNQRGV